MNVFYPKLILDLLNSNPNILRAIIFVKFYYIT